MKLNQQIIKWVAAGVLLGLFVTYGIQFGTNKYQLNQQHKKLEAFATGYNKATDKNAYMQNYNWGSKGVSVGLSTSKAASEGDDTCGDIEEAIDNISRVLDGGYFDYNNELKDLKEKLILRWISKCFPVFY